jgi:zinc protease
MVHFERFTLANGLRVIFHYDPTTPLAVVNTLYDVGARDEHPDKTGFAHLFEHLMFGGSINIPDFDTPLQLAGGESNAFTSNDITNYYDIVPGVNLETALWLESDRMLSLAFTPKSLETQRNVVMEEFKQRYLNQPYGDVWLELRPLAYEAHPYQWATIGKELKHIEDATMEDVKAFFTKFYNPSNAILCIAGNFELDYIKQVVEKWFGDIPSGIKPSRILPKEPKQALLREKIIDRKVPSDAIYFAFKMPERKSFEYYASDILSDAIGRDKSSRLYVRLQKELKLVTDIYAYITGSIDEGLLVIEAKLSEGIDFVQVEEAVWNVLKEIQSEIISTKELHRLKNKINTAKAFQEQGMLNRAMNLSFFELLGDANGVNEEQKIIDQINEKHIHTMANQILNPNNCSILKVKAI